MQKLAKSILALLILAAGNLLAAAAPYDTATAYARTDRLIVRMKHDTVARTALPDADHAVARERIGRKLQSMTPESITPLRTMGDGAHVIKLTRRLPLGEIQRIAATLAKDPDVLDIVPDRLFFPQATPTDPQYVNQWNLSQASGINMPAAWDISTGSSSMVIAVLDTGYLNHADLSGRWIGGYDFVSNTDRSNDSNLRDADAPATG